MGSLIPILTRLLSQALITVIVGGLSFLGYGNSTSTSSFFSASTIKFQSPIILDIQSDNIKISKINPTVSSSTDTVKNTPPEKSKSKTPTKKNEPVAATYIPKEAPIQIDTKTIPINVQPSLSTLPIPSIDDLPIASDIINSKRLGEWTAAFETSNQSIVNILCISSKGNLVTVSTGSGVIIGSQGIILTNAHVAQTFLLPNQDCTIRQGAIAADKYKASLVYINENWLRKNAANIFSNNARGTGEDDFALLAITKSINPSDPSSNIKYTKFQTDEIRQGVKGVQILAAGYPGGTLGALSLRKFLSFAYDTINISNVYTLDSRHTDIIETDVTKIGQHGSSGGGLFNVEGNLIGLIVSVNTNGNSSKVNALSLPYINRAIKNDSGKTLDEVVNTDKTVLLSSFMSKQDSLLEYIKPYIK